MTWRETGITLALWIGVCLVLFYGSWPVLLGAVLIAAIDHKSTTERVRKAYDSGFEIGKRSVKPIVISEQVGYKPTFCFANGRVFRVGRDC